ncbi:MAG TPA: SDR family NAD(P)-dependent oxidoreductase [Candidatus Saccharimonadales bacterium]
MKPINELLDLAGKVAVVTGAAKGIGFGIAYRLAEAGAMVLITDVDAEGAEAAAAKLTGQKWQARALTADVSSEDDVKRLIDTCAQDLGGLDILVNNAGIYPAEPIADMSYADFEKVIRVNLAGVFLTIKYGSELMKQTAGGKIINITSIDALHPTMVGLAHYDASKHGLWGLTKNAALELAPHNIQVNAIAPGGIATPGAAAMQQPSADTELLKRQTEAFLAKIPMHRMGEPDEIGKAVLFLASDMSSYMTGSQIVVDGGVLLS